jgi:alpha-1,2-rhamnosyltransferase
MNLFIDCTPTYLAPINTGIQRVVRNIIEHGSNAGIPLGIRVQPIFLIGRNGYRLYTADLKSASLEIRFRFWIKNQLSRFADAMQYVVRNFTHMSPRENGQTPHWTKPMRLRLHQFAKRTYLKSSELFHLRRRVRFGKGDVLLLADASWSLNDWSGVQAAQKTGARIGVLLYDLLPVTNPEWFDESLAESFQKWFERVVDEADFFLGISEATISEFRRQVRQRKKRGPALPPSVSFALGADFQPLHAGPGSIRSRVKEIFPKNGPVPVYLAVGTLEPRKNHGYILDAFDRLWSRGGNASLCIVGRKGWKCEEVLSRLEKHPEAGKRLFAFHDLEDEELLYCYDRARALLIASKNEGFGLPIIEALMRGLRVLASDIPVFREVGSDFCTYFDLSSPESLSKLIEREGQGALPEPRPVSEFGWVTWKQSAEDLLEKIRRLNSSNPQGRRPTTA